MTYHRATIYSATLLFALGAIAPPLVAEQPLTKQDVDTAIVRGLKIVTRGAQNYPRNRTCFSCHHQALPLLAMAEANAAGPASDERVRTAQIQFTRGWFQRQAERLREGRYVEGKATTVAYGLWTFDIARQPADDTSANMVAWLLKNQLPAGHWERQMSRPPLEDSNITPTMLAVRYMDRYGSSEQKPHVARSVEKARHWLATATAQTHEDRLSLLRALLWLQQDATQSKNGASKDEPRADRQTRDAVGPDPLHKDTLARNLAAVRRAIADAQNGDGGWGQLDGMTSDAYATGQTVWVLRQCGVGPDDPGLVQAARWLLAAQCEDGSWLVPTRNEPVQTVFDNGDPHGKHQFISIAGTSWAVAALSALRPR